MTTVIVDYASGNLHSALKSFQRMAGETGAGPVAVSGDPDAVRAADRIVLPGVGAFADCRAGLAAIPGLFEAIEERVIGQGAPFLGICVGQQMMASRGLEHGETAGFGWIPGDVVRIAPADPGLKVPHMGWNALEIAAAHPVMAGLASGAHAYFVHSYHLVPAAPAHRIATADHGGPITAVVARDNLFGTQFHPEKSQATGLRLIANFLAWRP
ncbi:MAG TPA: imidazole glycerol phosphate synthase subunit HisH [Amaricoccus sp.]|jgi:glutamine amidotransferase|nr:imidazole glycerol phosphate synthase subunit HisH [Amaricoccus sp.]